MHSDTDYELYGLKKRAQVVRLGATRQAPLKTIYHRTGQKSREKEQAIVSRYWGIRQIKGKDLE
jgi:hypothetical protein